MDKLEKELSLFKKLDEGLKRNKIKTIWSVTEHIVFLEKTLELHKIQEKCTHPSTQTNDISVHGRPRLREFCTICNKTLKEG